MIEGVTDPDTGTKFTCKVRKRVQRGFSKCNDCEYLRSKMRLAKDKEERDQYLRLYKRHKRHGDEDREEQARIARLCKMDERHVGVFIDAADSNKFGIPTTESPVQAHASTRTHTYTHTHTHTHTHTNTHTHATG